MPGTCAREMSPSTSMPGTRYPHVCTHGPLLGPKSQHQQEGIASGPCLSWCSHTDTQQHNQTLLLIHTPHTSHVYHAQIPMHRYTHTPHLSHIPTNTNTLMHRYTLKHTHIHTSHTTHSHTYTFTHTQSQPLVHTHFSYHTYTHSQIHPLTHAQTSHTLTHTPHTLTHTHTHHGG